MTMQKLFQWIGVIALVVFSANIMKYCESNGGIPECVYQEIDRATNTGISNINL